MSEFLDCDYVYLKGGSMDGQTVPVEYETNRIEFHVKGGARQAYKRTEVRKGDLIVFEYEGDNA